MAEEVDTRLARGRNLIAQAHGSLDGRPNPTARTAAEQLAREALAQLASALNWAEDTPREDDVHAELDAAGRWVRETFGCQLHKEGTQYSQRCPVALGHNRLGLSVGGVATRICSLCGSDLSECPHQRGTSYLVPGGLTDLEWCRVCLATEQCDHRPGDSYRAGVVSMIVEMELVEVSLVSRPAHPDARLSSVPITHDDLARVLGSRFTPGIPVSCDRCLGTCEGLTRHKFPHR